MYIVEEEEERKLRKRALRSREYESNRERYSLGIFLWNQNESTLEESFLCFQEETTKER